MPAEQPSERTHVAELAAETCNARIAVPNPHVWHLSVRQASRAQGAAMSTAASALNVRERGAQSGNAGMGRITGAQSRRRMTPINFP